MKKLLLNSILLLCALIVGTSSSWAAKTYKLTQVTSVSAGNKYVFVRNSHALSNSVSSSALQTSASYSTKGLSGTEAYVWTLETATGGFYIKNASLNSNQYVNNTSSTTITFGSKNSIWTIAFTDDVALISNTSNSNRFLGETESGSNVYKAYASSNLSSYGHDFTVYILEEEAAAAVATPTFSPAAGAFTSAQNVTISCETDGATIYYTKGDNPAEPTDASTEYTGAITVDATTTIKAIAKNGSDYSNVASATYTILPVNHAGNSGDPYTVTDARNALTAGATDSETDYYVTGYITKKNDISSGKLTYWLSDDLQMTKTIQCYNGKYIDGADFDDSNNLEVGDIATVKGKLTIYGGNTYEFTAGNEVVSITPRTKVNIATFTATTNPLILGVTENTTTTVTNDQVGWTPVSYTYSSDDESVATVDEYGVVTAVAKGTANITVTPDVDATDPTYKVGDSKSIEITVSYPSHTASFSINGVIDPANNKIVEEGEAITFPTKPDAILGKSFFGWSTAAIGGNQDIEPATLVDPENTNMGDADIIYYAVFAASAEGTVTKTDNITLAMTGVSGNSYSSWNNKQASQGSNAIYAGCNAGGNDAIQLNASTSNSKRGIISTSTGGTLKKITVTWNSNSNNSRSLVVYGSTSAYESLSSFNSSKGTELGSIPKSSGTELTITGNYTYVGLYATEAIYLDQISIDWETTGTIYSAYCTTVVPDEPTTPTVDDVAHTVTLTTTANMAGWRTFAPVKDDQNYTVDGTTKVYYASATADGKVTLTEIADGVPANTPVILHQTSGTTITLTETATSISAPGSNLLQVSSANDNLGTVYRLGYKSAYGVGFYTYTTNSAPVGIIYLSSVSTARDYLEFTFDDETTGVDDVRSKMSDGRSEYFNLAGQRVAQPTKGLYIVNGKKYVIK